MSDKTNASRRDFLKGTTAVAAGVAVASQISIARTAHAAGSDVIKAALIGCGGRGNGAIEDSMNADPAIKVIAVADAFEDRAKGTAKRLREKRTDRVDLPDDRVFFGLDAFEKAIAAGADLIITATPPGFRPMVYAAAIAAGKHVFMEKPCCVDAAGLPEADGSQQDGRGEGPEGRRRLPAPAPARVRRDRSSGFTTGRSARSRCCAPTGTAAASGTARARKARRKCSTRSTTGTTSAGSAATTSASSTSTTWTSCNWAWAKDGDPKCAPGRSQRHGRLPAALPGRQQGHGPDLRRALRRVHLRRRHQDVQPVPAHPQHLQQRQRSRPRRARASRIAPAGSRARTEWKFDGATASTRWSRSTRT